MIRQHHDLGGIEIAVNPARLRLWHGSRQLLAGCEQLLQPGRPLRSGAANQRKLLLQDAQFVSQSVAAFGGNAGLMKLVGSFGHAARQFDSARLGKEFSGRHTGHLHLQPHLKLRNNAKRLRHRNPVGGVCPETSVSEGFEQIMRCGIRLSCVRLA